MQSEKNPRSSAAQTACALAHPTCAPRPTAANASPKAPPERMSSKPSQSAAEPGSGVSSAADTRAGRSSASTQAARSAKSASAADPARSAPASTPATADGGARPSTVRPRNASAGSVASLTDLTGRAASRPSANTLTSRAVLPRTNGTNRASAQKNETMTVTIVDWRWPGGRGDVRVSAGSRAGRGTTGEKRGTHVLQQADERPAQADRLEQAVHLLLQQRGIGRVVCRVELVLRQGSGGSGGEDERVVGCGCGCGWRRSVGGEEAERDERRRVGRPVDGGAGSAGRRVVVRHVFPVGRAVVGIGVDVDVGCSANVSLSGAGLLDHRLVVDRFGPELALLVQDARDALVVDVEVRRPGVSVGVVVVLRPRRPRRPSLHLAVGPSRCRRRRRVNVLLALSGARDGRRARARRRARWRRRRCRCRCRRRRAVDRLGQSVCSRRQSRVGSRRASQRQSHDAVRKPVLAVLDGGDGVEEPAQAVAPQVGEDRRARSGRGCVGARLGRFFVVVVVVVGDRAAVIVVDNDLGGVDNRVVEVLPAVIRPAAVAVNPNIHSHPLLPALNPASLDLLQPRPHPLLHLPYPLPHHRPRRSRCPSRDTMRRPLAQQEKREKDADNGCYELLAGVEVSVGDEGKEGGDGWAGPGRVGRGEGEGGVGLRGRWEGR